MPADTELAEPDRLEGAPHPREQTAFFGHPEAETAFLDAIRSGRLHHAWLIGGPEGIGKATLAYRIARFLLAHGGGTPSGARDLSVEVAKALPTKALPPKSSPGLRLKKQWRRSPGFWCS